MDPDEGASAWQRTRRGLVRPTTTDRLVPTPSIPAFGGFTPDTQRDYIRAIKKLAVVLGRSPDTATAEELRAFQLHLTVTGVQPPTINATVTVLRFFFKVTLDRPETTRHLVFVYEPRKLSRVFSPEDVLRPCKQTSETDQAQPLADPCPCCGGRMLIIEIFDAGCQPQHRPTRPVIAIRIDTS